MQRAILSSSDLLAEGGATVKSLLAHADCCTGTNGASTETRECGVLPNLKFDFETAGAMADFLEAHPRIRLLDVCFTDPLGQWHHCTISVEHISERTLASGFGFDASSIPMFEKIENSDFIMIPDPHTCFLDPFATFPTLHVTASIFKPTGDPYEKCPRQILIRALDYMRDSGIADEIFFGPEAEFFLFNSARFSVAPHNMLFHLDGDEAYWNYNSMREENSSGQNKENLAHRANLKEGYMTGRPVDKTADIRSEMLLILEQLGVKTEKHHHEVATCQMEVNVQATSGLQAVDNLQTLKYTIKNVAEKKGKTATFMPKPIATDNGSGMHCNQSLWKYGRNLFYDQNSKCHELSELGNYYTAGILQHCKAVIALACPTTNSYRRLVPDFEAPIHLTYSAGNRSTAIRIPTFVNEKTKRIEFRVPDASCCPYLAFAAMLLAGLDGVTNKTELPGIGKGNLFDTNNVSAKSIARCPTSLDEALDALEADHHFLTKQGVFTEAFIATFIAHKRRECAALRCCPHPREFMLYYGC